MTAGEAKNHVGETATVCEIVVDTHFVSSGKGQPTFLHFDEPYPNQIFAWLISEPVPEFLSHPLRRM
jgi:hypothetical protein